MSDDDLEFLTGLLLEREQPLSTETLARALIERRLDREAETLRERYQNARVYNPSHTYEIGQKVVFPVMDYALATITEVRPGLNPEYGDFDVIKVAFEDETSNGREFASGLKTAHKLSQGNGENADFSDQSSTLTVDDILDAAREEIFEEVDRVLTDTPDLVVLAGKWFPRGLMLDVNEGHLFLVDAVLDLAGGGPMETEQILGEIGGLGTGSQELEVFSLNYALNEDERFDEVGPAGQVLWYLSRLEPEEVQQIPAMLRYKDIEHDRSLLTPEMLALEAEIDDELSPLKSNSPLTGPITITLIYPHRRVGTLPLNARMRHIFPTARRTQHIWCTLVDGQDGEEYQGWVARRERYVYGLTAFYRKHKLPVGAYVTVRPGDTPDKIVVDFRAHRPRTEWIRLIAPQSGHIHFENHKRAIGAEYDDLMILGADDLEAVDALFTSAQQNNRPLNGILRALVGELSRLTPQGAVHVKTLYSATNVIKRCPPGPIFATLINDPAFEHVGNHYWKLSSNT